MKLSAEDERFLEDIAGLMTPWGWPRPVGRIYAYLLLRAAPATLDEIAADLGMSKSNASVAARTLEHCGNARRHSEPGSKRIYYAVPENHGGPFAAKAELLGRLERLFDRQSARALSEDVTGRFDTLATFYARMRNAMEEVIDGEQAEAAPLRRAPGSA
ncbi:GbsR/MarR family transcriptional regulator [Novosphingobium sp. M1R2S20]|uniref:GbsR/MarR family transcriptional regulator n=1 Tax=Novosphingobium rhizovicinum TaxID=3228928 RepID=A0ABV3RBH7_9SPHN